MTDPPAASSSLHDIWTSDESDGDVSNDSSDAVSASNASNENKAPRTSELFLCIMQVPKRLLIMVTLLPPH